MEVIAKHVITQELGNVLKKWPSSFDQSYAISHHWRVFAGYTTTGQLFTFRKETKNSQKSSRLIKPTEIIIPTIWTSRLWPQTGPTLTDAPCRESITGQPRGGHFLSTGPVSHMCALSDLVCICFLYGHKATHIYVYIIYTYTDTHTHIYIYIPMCARVCVCVCVRVHACVYMHPRVTCVHVCITF